MKMNFAKLKPLVRALIEQGLILFPSILIIRFFDLFLFEKEVFTTNGELLRIFAIILYKELVFLVLYLITVGLLLGLIKLASKPIYWFSTVLSSTFMVFLYLSTSQYYHTSYLLLDHVILFFTLDEILEIASTETGQVTGQFFWYYFSPILLLVLSFVFHKKISGFVFNSKIPKAIFATALIVLGVNFMTKNAFLTEKQKIIVTSKPKHIISSVINHWNEQNDLINLDKKEFFTTVNEFRDFMGWENSANQVDYPFNRKLRKNENHLETYFNEFDKAPNVVMVFCEGLSSTFSGPEAVLESMTPNLDKLYSKSLYWPNTISNTDRTHGVFANALASLPHGKVRGMLNLKSTFPQHLSIPKILVSNGYHSSFSYGGWGYFDNFEPFLKKNYVENIWDKDYLVEQGIYKVKDNGTAFTWGIQDNEMVDLYFELKGTNAKTPFFDIFLNLSLHSPFDIPQEEKYKAIAKERMKNVKDGETLYENYKEVIAAVIYQDEALGSFMEEYEKRPEYENTIFVFVGDHNVNTLPLRSELDSHYVPLAIFSPKLKQAKKFKDIVAHTDIPHSITTLLAPYLNVKEIPEQTSWIGNGLSTNNTLSADQPKFIGRFNGDIIGLIYADTLLMNDQLYKISGPLNITEIKGKERKKYFDHQLRNYKIMNQYVVDNLKLLLPADTLEYPNAKGDFFFPEYD
ncbi:LTA synthase family protein [Brumimicrobium oceani]|uniref:Sulfatase N-terminal domain-containing protein n=1 Tax=Brumimicrobium oceani TaxID=2100725 RepID=A0A2U2X0G4_9FLAO|nr:LTA synthase family protein [Brumimicrobium oceani]PWH81263.1 hypothetical protein DIT68_15835 [Brumimicrobium oceani]